MRHAVAKWQIGMRRGFTRTSTKDDSGPICKDVVSLDDVVTISASTGVGPKLNAVIAVVVNLVILDESLIAKHIEAMTIRPVIVDLRVADDGSFGACFEDTVAEGVMDVAILDYRVLNSRTIRVWIGVDGAWRGRIGVEGAWLGHYRKAVIH